MAEDLKSGKRKIHKIVITRSACIGAATCVVIAPKAFDLDKESIAVLKPDAMELDDNTILMAAQSCPTQAILLFDEDGKQIFPAL
jgi:ferredoxin